MVTSVPAAESANSCADPRWPTWRVESNGLGAGVERLGGHHPPEPGVTPLRRCGLPGEPLAGGDRAVCGKGVRPEVRTLVDADPLDPQDATFGGDIDAGPIDDIDDLSGRSVDGLGGTGLSTPDGYPVAVDERVRTGVRTREATDPLRQCGGGAVPQQQPVLWLSAWPVGGRLGGLGGPPHGRQMGIRQRFEQPHAAPPQFLQDHPDVITRLDRHGRLVDDGARIDASIIPEHREPHPRSTGDQAPGDGCATASCGQPARMEADEPRGGDIEDLRVDRSVPPRAHADARSALGEPPTRRRTVDVCGLMHGDVMGGTELCGRVSVRLAGRRCPRSTEDAHDVPVGTQHRREEMSHQPSVAHEHRSHRRDR
jgi:hypothetical protein